MWWQRRGWKKEARLHLKIKEVVRRDIQIPANFLDLCIIQLINAVFKAAVLLLRHQHVRGDFLLRQLQTPSCLFDIFSDDFTEFHTQIIITKWCKILDLHHFVVYY